MRAKNGKKLTFFRVRDWKGKSQRKYVIQRAGLESQEMWKRPQYAEAAEKQHLLQERTLGSHNADNDSCVIISLVASRIDARNDGTADVMPDAEYCPGNGG